MLRRNFNKLLSIIPFINLPIGKRIIVIDRLDETSMGNIGDKGTISKLLPLEEVGMTDLESTDIEYFKKKIFASMNISKSLDCISKQAIGVVLDKNQHNHGNNVSWFYKSELIIT